MLRLVLKIRHFLYDKGLKKVRTAPVPTICVGNVAVGGTGKTPHTELILSLLLQSDWAGSRNLAVLSRGYKRRSRGFQQVVCPGIDGSRDAGQGISGNGRAARRKGECPAAFAGDEPLQIKKKFPVVTVAVDKNRVEGCRFLADPAALAADRRASRRCKNPLFPASELIVLDDAFQYRKLKASLDIVLVDWNRPVFKDRLLPFGRLRDLPERLGAADIIIVTKCPYELDNWERTSFAYALGLADFASSASAGTNARGKKQYVFFTRMEYEAFEGVFPDSDNRYIYSKNLILFTGIANDTPLRRYLSDSYKTVCRFSFPDHHRFSRGDFARIGAAVAKWPTAVLATTEKDAQRVLDSGRVPKELRERMFQVPIRAEFLLPAEKNLFCDILRERLAD